jgi:sugar diacid utilization regulator
VPPARGGHYASGPRPSLDRKTNRRPTGCRGVQSRAGRGTTLATQLPSDTTAELRVEVEGLLDALASQVDRIAEEMVEAIASEIPAYGQSRSSALLEGVRAHCARHAQLMFTCLREDREPRVPELAFARDAAARRVSQGIPLQALLQAFRLGHRTVWDAILRAAPATPAGSQAALGLARPAMQYIDAASTHVAEIYLEQERRLLATADRERRDLLENLLAGRLPAQSEIPAAAAGIAQQARLLVAVVHVSSPGPVDPDDLHRAADVIAGRCADPRAEPLVVVRQGEIVIVLAPDELDADPYARLRSAQRLLAERRGIPTRVGISARFGGLLGVAEGYTEARQALLRTTEERSLIALEELSTFDYLVATADPAAWQVARRTAVALSDAGLSETVAAYVDCDGDVGAAAERLGVHPNTIRYRLRRVAEVTGRDPSLFHDLVELAAVTRMARARAPS